MTTIFTLRDIGQEQPVYGGNYGPAPPTFLPMSSFIPPCPSLGGVLDDTMSGSSNGRNDTITGHTLGGKQVTLRLEPKIAAASSSSPTRLSPCPAQRLGYATPTIATVSSTALNTTAGGTLKTKPLSGVKTANAAAMLPPPPTTRKNGKTLRRQDKTCWTRYYKHCILKDITNTALRESVETSFIATFGEATIPTNKRYRLPKYIADSRPEDLFINTR